MRLGDLVQTSAAVGAHSGRLQKISLLAEFLGRLTPSEIPVAIGFLTGWPRQGRIGVGWAAVASAREQEAASTATLELLDVDRVLDQLQAVKGKGSGAKRSALLTGLFARA